MPDVDSLSSEKRAFAIAVSEIRDLDAATAKTIGYMPKTLIDTTLPHRRPVDEQNRPLSRYTRKNGRKTLSMASTYEEGLPFGSIPRILMCLIATQAVLTQSREICLGKNLSEVLKRLDLENGGRNISRLKHQVIAIFSTLITHRIEKETKKEQDKQDIKEYLGIGKNISIADEWQLYWTAGAAGEENEEKKPSCTVILTEKFFNEISEHAVPVDTRALKALSRSPLAIDIYCWLTWRYFKLPEPTLVPWSKLAVQFGAEYGRLRDFKKKFLEQLETVKLLYPQAVVFATDKGLILKPSPTHVPRRNKR